MHRRYCEHDHTHDAVHSGHSVQTTCRFLWSVVMSYMTTPSSAANPMVVEVVLAHAAFMEVASQAASALQRHVLAGMGPSSR